MGGGRRDGPRRRTVRRGLRRDHRRHRDPPRTLASAPADPAGRLRRDRPALRRHPGRRRALPRRGDHPAAVAADRRAEPRPEYRTAQPSGMAAARRVRAAGRGRRPDRHVVFPHDRSTRTHRHRRFVRRRGRRRDRAGPPRDARAQPGPPGRVVGRRRHRRARHPAHRADRGRAAGRHGPRLRRSGRRRPAGGHRQRLLARLPGAARRRAARLPRPVAAAHGGRRPAARHRTRPAQRRRHPVLDDHLAGEPLLPDRARHRLRGLPQARRGGRRARRPDLPAFRRGRRGRRVRRELRPRRARAVACSPRPNRRCAAPSGWAGGTCRSPRTP
ncbi:hypothetical protein EDD35_2826 [Amycolatopsis thermoflava]|uniref:Uncharacterized protein n=1 Tax=Amycolatopsis thermoflava TaxID=84480 RepID=A0A3N2GW58_9PSEU|nr:hypothetical protein EDD35_2826 [Amycolatopsis thermoflava]